MSSLEVEDKPTLVSVRSIRRNAATVIEKGEVTLTLNHWLGSPFFTDVIGTHAGSLA